MNKPLLNCWILLTNSKIIRENYFIMWHYSEATQFQVCFVSNANEGMWSTFIPFQRNRDLLSKSYRFWFYLTVALWEFINDHSKKKNLISKTLNFCSCIFYWKVHVQANSLSASSLWLQIISSQCPWQVYINLSFNCSYLHFKWHKETWDSYVCKQTCHYL